jgi:hypothetical protein
LANVLLQEIPGRAGGFRRDHWVEDDPAGLCAYEGDVGQVQPADLVDPRDHLVQAVVVVQDALAVQRRVNAVELILRREELKPLHVPGDVPRVGLDFHLLHRGDETLLLLLKIAAVGQRQVGLGLAERLDRKLRRRLALGVEVPGVRGDLLRERRPLAQHHVTGHRERGQRLDELPPREHGSLLEVKVTRSRVRP